ncbi:MAG: cytochrome b [bacterium]|nr:MAG: cytochrome b [bacterium]
MSNERGIWVWINERLPVSGFLKASMTEYYAPKNFNFWYFFGSLALLVLVMQIFSGIFLLVHYYSGADQAFDSVQGIMFDVKWGWLVRYIHTTGATMFFLVIYLHISRAFLYGSYRKPRELLWIFGWIIYIVLMAEAYLGYVMPFGNMSYWGGEVITAIIGAIPGIGDWLVSIVRGGPGFGGATLTRFMAWHVAFIPLLLIVIVVLHLVALHTVGSNNPDGIEISKKLNADGRPLDGIPFHPYYTVKDIYGVGVFLTLFAMIVLFAPTLNGLIIESDNYIPANYLQTPPDVTPAWYLSPYYAILRSIPEKGLGIIMLGLSIILPFFLPWLDRCPAKSVRYRPVYFVMLILLAIAILVLGWIGLQPASPALLPYARVALAVYFGFFILLPIISKFEPVRPVPDRVRS